MHQLVHGMAVVLILFANSSKILVVLIQIHKLLEMFCIATQCSGKLSSYFLATYVKIINQLL